MLIPQIKLLASLLGMGQGEMLQLARIEAEDGDILALEFLTSGEQTRLFQDLNWLKSLDTEIQVMTASR